MASGKLGAVQGVIADWLAGGGGDLEYGDFWFALPKTSKG